jgi:glycosyltransferase involved in cell wall biosynthesis
VVVDLAIELRARGWAVAVLSMIEPTHHLDALKAADVEVATLGMTRGRPTPGALIRYAAFVRSWRPDVVHSHMVHANLLARIGRVFAPRVPVVCTIHSITEGRRWREIAYRLTDPFASATTAVSSAAAERYVRVGAVPRGRMAVIPNGLARSRQVAPVGARDAVRSAVKAEGNFLWVTAGRLVAEKGHEMLLRAFDALRLVRPHVSLAIAGDGPERQALNRLAVELGLGQAVQLLGERDDVPTILAAADGFVLSSHWEGLPMVLLEAAWQGLPIVSTDVGGCRQVASPELGAVLTESSAAALTDGMLRIMDLSAAERARIGQQLRDHVRSEFDMNAIVERWEGLYVSVIAS